MQRVLADLSLVHNGCGATDDVLATLLHQLEIVYRELVAIDALGEDNNTSSAVSLVGQAIEEVQQLEEVSRDLPNSVYTSPVEHLGVIGRPRYFIPSHMLESLINMGFSVPQIASILFVSVRTVRRRMSEHGLSIHATYSIFITSAGHNCREHST